MHISKRFLAGLMAVVLCASMMIISSVAGTSDITVQAKVDSASVKQGDKVSVDILLSSENKVDFAAGDFQVNFDSDVLSVEATDKMVTSYEVGEIVKNANNFSISNPKDGVLKVLYCDETDEQNGAIKADGVLATIEFTVASDAPVGSTEITFTENGDYVIPDENETSGFKNYTVEYKGISLSVVALEPPTTEAPSTEAPTTNSPTTNPPTTNPPTTVKPTDKPTQGTPDADDDNKVSAKKPAKVKGVKVKAAKKKVTVTWKKAKNAKKYRVKYSYKKNLKKAKFQTTKKTKLVIKKLKSGKKVYVQVQGLNGKVKGKFSAKKVSKKIK